MASHALLAILLLSPTAPQSGLQTLLPKLSAHEARMQAFSRTCAVTITNDTAELDGDGKLRHQVRAVMEVTRRDGQAVTRLLSAIKDGREDRREGERKASEQDRYLNADSPFSARAQGRYRFTLVGPDRAAPSLVRIAFSPRDGKGPGVFRGEATVDPDTGELVRMKVQPTVYPALVDRVDVQFDYGAQTPAGRMLSAVGYSGSGGFLFFKRQRRGTLTFQYDVWDSTASQGSGGPGAVSR
jgi:hypothetical protein